MKIENIPADLSRDQIRDILSENYKRHTIEYPPFNKKILTFPLGNTLIRVIKKKDRILVKSGPNTKNPLIMIALVAGVLTGLVGVLVVFGIIYAVNGKKYKEKRIEVGRFLDRAIKVGAADAKLEQELHEL